MNSKRHIHHLQRTEVVCLCIPFIKRQTFLLSCIFSSHIFGQLSFWCPSVQTVYFSIVYISVDFHSMEKTLYNLSTVAQALQQEVSPARKMRILDEIKKLQKGKYNRRNVTEATGKYFLL